MFSVLSVIVLGDSRARPLHVSTHSFVIVSWLEVVLFVIFPMRKQCHGVMGCRVETLNRKVLGFALGRARDAGVTLLAGGFWVCLVEIFAWMLCINEWGRGGRYYGSGMDALRERIPMGSGWTLLLFRHGCCA